MSGPISYTPPNATHALDDAPDRPVRRRHVVYLPGYDPEARSRYRLLFVRELTLYAKRFGGGKREVGRAGFSADGLVQNWRIAAHPATAGAETSYDVLLWDDLIARDAARSRFVSAALLSIGTIHTLTTGLIVGWYKQHWKYGNIVIYPFVMLALLAAAGILIAAAVHAWLDAVLAAIGLGALSLPGWATLCLGIAAGLAFIRAVEAALNRIYFWQLLNDWVFNWVHAQRGRGDYEARLDVFVDHIRQRLDAFARDGEAIDEVLIIGHSTGALTAVEVTARLIARETVEETAQTSGEGTGRGRPLLALATLGSGLPLVAMQARATRVRSDIASLVTCRRLAWIDYVAPQDWLNFPHFNPIHDLDLSLGPAAVLANPTIRSARFRDIIGEETYRKVRFRPFRMHFQFLMANDRPGAYDFFAMTLGPQTLRERVLEREAASGEPAGASHARAGRDVLAA